MGAGGGHVLRLFPDARLTAIDVSQVFLDTAQKNLAGYDARFVKGEVDKLDLPAESYDRIICTEVLEHTVDPEAILAAMARLLRRDGVLVVTVPNDPLILQMKAVLRRTPLGLLLRNRIDWGGNVYHIHRWRPAEFERMLARHSASRRGSWRRWGHCRSTPASVCPPLSRPRTSEALGGCASRVITFVRGLRGTIELSVLVPLLQRRGKPTELVERTEASSIGEHRPASSCW